MSIASFDKSNSLLHRSLDANAYRYSVLANNLANADVAHFKRSDVHFESDLRRALESENRPRFNGRYLYDRHIPFNRPKSWNEVEPSRHLDYLSQSDQNGNNVDLEIESMLLMQTQMRYSLMVQSLQHNYAMVNLVAR